MNEVDLQSLRIDDSTQVPRRPWRHRVLPWGLALFTLTLLATFLVPLWWQPRRMPMADVRLAAATGRLATATVAEAAGWVEPDPFHVLVRPLVAGCVESIDVLEGAPVKAHETVLAHLVSAPLQAAHDRATAAVREREQDLAVASSQARLAAAQLEQRGALRQAAHETARMLAEREAKLAAVRGAHRRAIAEIRAATAAKAAQQQLLAAGGSYALALARAEAALAAAEASASAAEQEAMASEREVAAATAARDVAAARFAQPVDLQGAAEVAEAQVAKAMAALATARTEVTITTRELAWTKVLAPCDGVVLRLHSTPGAMAGPQGDPLLALYDPQHLRARIDVPLAVAGGIRDGQAVELRSELLGDVVVHGTVQRTQRESDLLKNTLQVKVALRDPPALLRPETLCRARFLADANAPTSGDSGPRTFVLPKEAVQGGVVFRFDPTAKRARAVTVTVVGEQGGDVLVRGDLAPTQRVVLIPVHDGDPVQEESR